MLRTDIGSTFSDSWYRVARTRPRVSPHAQIVRQHYGPHISFVVEEPASGNYYRLTEPAYFFVGLLDGRRTVEEAWDACNAQLGDNAPTQRECVELLGKLQLFGLLLGELPLAADMVLERIRVARKQRRDRRTGRWMSPALPLVNPENFLERHAGLIRLVFSRMGLAVWLGVVAAAVAMVIVNWREFGAELNRAGLLDPGNLIWITVTFMVLRAVHELGHAAACKAFGGRVTEMGLLLVAGVLPLPYCDTSSAWRFPSLRRRVLVSVGGVMAEGFVAALAAIVWAVVRPESAPLVHSVCYNVMVVSGVVTFLFNLNPLLRYDGYYVLSDLTGTPNLAQRANDLWRAALHRYAFGVRTVRPPSLRGPWEAALLWVYGALSAPYRALVLGAIVIVILSRFPAAGMVIAVVVAAAWGVWPVMRAIGYLSSSAALSGHRARAWAVTLGTLAGAAAFVVLAPMPAAAYAPGSVEPLVRVPLRAGESGFLVQVIAADDATVAKDERLLVLDNPQAAADLAATEARVQRARVELQKASAGGDQGERRVAEEELAAREAEYRRAQDRAAALTITAPASGRLITPASDQVQLRSGTGRFYQRGALLGTIVSTDDLIVRVSVSDKEAAQIFHAITGAGGPRPAKRPVTIKVHGLAAETIDADVIRLVPAGSRELAEPSLSIAAGGTILVDPSDQTGRKTLVPQYVVELRPRRLPEGVQPGLRAEVRFSLAPEPLLDQWIRRARQYLKDRLG